MRISILRFSSVSWSIPKQKKKRWTCITSFIFFAIRWLHLKPSVLLGGLPKTPKCSGQCLKHIQDFLVSSLDVYFRHQQIRFQVNEHSPFKTSFTPNFAIP